MSCLSHHHHQLHVHSYTITPCYISNITPQQTCTRWATSQLSVPYYRSSSSLALRSDNTCCYHRFHFPLSPSKKKKKKKKKKILRSTFTNLTNILPFYMFYLLSIHVLNCTVMLPVYHLILFPFTCFFSKFKVARTLFFKLCPLHISRSDAPIVPRCCRLGQCEWSPDTESAVGASSGGHREVIGQY